MPKHKIIQQMGVKTNYEPPLTQTQRDGINEFAAELERMIEKKYPGIDYCLAIGSHTTVTGCATALVVQILNLLNILMERVGGSEEGMKRVGLIGNLLASLTSPEDTLKICKYYDGDEKFDPQKIQGPEAKA